MTRNDALHILNMMVKEEQLGWMHCFARNLTVAARGSYPTENHAGNVHGLMCVNEIQHRVLARIDAFQRGDEWSNESFLDLIFTTASFSGIAGDVGWALKDSLEAFEAKAKES